MQEKKHRNEQFLKIFNDLAGKKAFNIVQMCSFLGISRTLIYEIRDGKKEVTDKTWNKIKKAERESSQISGVVDLNKPAESPIESRVRALEESDSLLKNQIAEMLHAIANLLQESGRS